MKPTCSNTHLLELGYSNKEGQYNLHKFITYPL